MKFYDCTTAPSPKRVRMFIAEKNIQIPVVEVDLANREQHTDEFAKLNPYRTVPALELDDGTVLTTSSGICHYLEAVYPTPSLMGSDAKQRGIIADLEWRVDNEGFLAVGEAFRNRAKSFKNNALPGANEYAQIPELVERGRVRAQHFIEWLDKQLDNKEFIAGEVFSMADITAYTALEFAKWIKLEPSADHKNVVRWFNVVAARDSAKL